VLNTHLPERGLYASADFWERQSELQRPEGDIVTHSRREQLNVRILEDEADPTVKAVGLFRVGAYLLNVGPEDAQVSDRRSVETVKDFEKRGLAAAVSAQHGNRFPLPHSQVDAIEADLPVVVNVTHILEIEDTCGLLHR
jgi:hypothetical protein